MTDLILLKDWVNSAYEFWLPIQGFAGYDVSNKGNVRSYWTRVGGRWIIGDTSKLRKQTANVEGYKLLPLTRNGIRFDKKVSHLVAEAFIPNERPGIAKIPNHRNNVSSDNRIDNLEWTTHSENILHANEIGVGGRGEKKRKRQINQRTGFGYSASS